MRTRPGHAFEWRKHRNDSEYWGRRALDASKITVPTFMVEGWHDFFTDGAVRTYLQLNCDKQMVMGPWLHVCPDLVDREQYDWVGEMSGLVQALFDHRSPSRKQADKLVLTDVRRWCRTMATL